MADVAWVIFRKDKEFMKGVGKKRVTLYKNLEVALRALENYGDMYGLAKVSLEVVVE